MTEKEALYSRIVKMKKRFIRREIVPRSIAPSIDSFFNNLHNSVIRSRDLSKDAISRSGSLMRATLERSQKGMERAIAGAGSKTREESRGAFAYLFNFSKNLAAIMIESIDALRWNITEESDKEAVQNIGKIMTNSENVKERIKRYYGRDSKVIYPPIDTENIKPGQDSGYWLSVNRITPEKRIEMQIEAFRKMPGDRLVIAGGYESSQQGYAKSLEEKCLPNVRFLGAVPADELVSLYSKCRGFIATAMDEDFGMTVVEAMAAGKPVVAGNEGGYRETVTPETGILIDDIDQEKLRDAVKKISSELSANQDRFREACIARAKHFSVEHFAEKTRNFITGSFYSNPEKQLVFIAGVPRSGTTWLWGLLTSHPDVEPILKSDFSGIRPSRKDGKFESVETNMLFDHSLEEIRSVIDRKKARFIVEKTPDHLLRIGRIHQEFPGAKIIHVIRNPFSVYASWKNSDWDKRVGSVREWLPFYLKRISAFIEHRDDGNMMTVSYEALRKNPEKSLRDIFRFVGLEARERLAGIIAENAGVSKSIGKHSIRKAEAQSWREELSEREIRAIHAGVEKFKPLGKYLGLPLSWRLRLMIKKRSSFKEKNLVFIVGIPRSGTTWLWTLLSHHPDVDTLTRRDFSKDIPTRENYPLTETNMLFDFPPRKIREVVASKERETVIEKTPLHLTRLDFIRKEFPRAKILHVIRDPVSIYASSKFTEYDGWNERGIPLERWIAKYKEAFGAFLPHIDSENMITISYENLLADAEGELRAVYDFLGLDKRGIAEAVEKSSYEKMLPKTSKLRGRDTLSAKLSPEDIGLIRKNLKNEIATLERMQRNSRERKNRANLSAKKV